MTTPAPTADEIAADVVVVGAGPAGIVTALELGDAGHDVVLVESGGERYDPDAQALSDAASLDPSRHAPMALATRRQLGGATTIWGGRCVPYDPVDFDRRPWITDACWPVGYDELQRYFGRACDWFQCGRPVFDATEIPELPPSLVPGLANDGVTATSLERWSLPTNFGRRYGARLRATRTVRVLEHVTCTRVVASGGHVERLEAKASDGRAITLRARTYVLACGGLESTRLLLASRDESGRSLGNHSDDLGRWYMGHVEGVVALARFTTPPRATVFDYERDVDGTFVRRRLAFTREYQLAHELPNIASWLVHPEIADASHASGVLSAAYLALCSPLGRRVSPDALRLAMVGERVPGVPYGGAEQSPLTRHLANILREPVATSRFVFGFGARRFVSRGRRVPGFSVYRPDNAYPLQYHGEHRPQRDSRVTLDDSRDRLGVPRLRIDVRFADADVEGVVEAHRRWDDHLRSNGVGKLEYLVDDVDAAVRERLGAGFHQSGTTRMSERPEDGVVDANLAVHGLPNLHVVSSSVFPTSSQANSTFMIVVFALRLADRLKRG
ncbi:MAG TPA: GMC family oxidoreductase [Gaiellaceae bacterium]|nr:GMC family oxidoreductase [Gaiellaceae bacterium]